MSIFHVFEKNEKQGLDSANYKHSYLCTKVAQSLNRPTIYLLNNMTRCTLFCDYCEILRNKHVV